jgi:hypothetical protein
LNSLQIFEVSVPPRFPPNIVIMFYLKQLPSRRKPWPFGTGIANNKGSRSMKTALINDNPTIHERLEVIMTGGLRAKGNGVSGRPLDSIGSKNDRRYHT